PSPFPYTTLFRSEMGLAEHMEPRYLERLQRVARWLEGVRQQCMQGDAIAALRDMVSDLDYENWIRQNCSSDEIAAKRMGNVWFLLDSLKATMERDETGETTFEDAIAKLVLRDMLERQEEEEDADR